MLLICQRKHIVYKNDIDIQYYRQLLSLNRYELIY